MNLKAKQINTFASLMDYILENYHYDDQIDVMLNSKTLEKLPSNIVTIPHNVTLYFNDSVPECSFIIRKRKEVK